MEKFSGSITELIGSTPLLKLNRLKRELGLYADIFAKLEYFNPGGSVKDRIAYAMIRDAESSGKLKPGSVIIEPTSGNTGIGIAMCAASMGYKAILTMPETMSAERRSLLAAYGAQLVLTEGSKGMKGAIEKARELCESIENSVLLGQFENPENPHSHYMTTARELWDAMDGKINMFVSGVGTGGTISGVGRYLKEQNPEIRIVAVEPLGSPVLSEGKPGKHRIQGIGAGFVPDTLDTGIYDSVFTVSDSDAAKMAALAAKTEGILVGISSGAALFAATELAKSAEYSKKNIIILLPDTGERYLSEGIFPNK